MIKMLQIHAPHFSAGCEVCREKRKDRTQGIVVAGCAPIIKYMEGWLELTVRKYCDKKGWRVDTLIIPNEEE